MSAKPNLEPLSPRGEIRLERLGTPGVRLTVSLYVRPEPDTPAGPVTPSYLYLPLTLLAARLK